MATKDWLLNIFITMLTLYFALPKIPYNMNIQKKNDQGVHDCMGSIDRSKGSLTIVAYKSVTNLLI